MTGQILGDLEQIVLLHILRARSHAFALEVRRGIEQDTGKPVSRGAFYTTLERLARKGFVTWEMCEPENARRRGKQRRFTVTPDGIEALHHTRKILAARSARLGEALEEM
jgi:PadR family transcriptional regulator PadR